MAISSCFACLDHIIMAGIRHNGHCGALLRGIVAVLYLLTVFFQPNGENADALRANFVIWPSHPGSQNEYCFAVSNRLDNGPCQRANPRRPV